MQAGSLFVCVNTLHSLECFAAALFITGGIAWNDIIERERDRQRQRQTEMYITERYKRGREIGEGRITKRYEREREWERERKCVHAIPQLAYWPDISQQAVYSLHRLLLG